MGLEKSVSKQHGLELGQRVIVGHGLLGIIDVCDEFDKPIIVCLQCLISGLGHGLQPSPSVVVMFLCFLVLSPRPGWYYCG